VRPSIVYLNGRFLLATEARISVLDRGLLYGDGLFETVRIYQGSPFLLGAHLRRIRAGGRRIELTIPGGVEFWRRRIRELLRRSGSDGAHAAVRLTVTRGLGGEWLLPPRRIRPTTLLTQRPLDPNLPRLKSVGVRVVLLPFHPGLGGFLSGLKTIDYLTAMVGKQIARRRKAYEGIYSTEAGEVLEGTTSNLFVVYGRSVLTPPLQRGVLPGVTRGLVMRMAEKEGFRVSEERLSKRDLEGADEAFLTASTIEILPIRWLGRQQIGNGTNRVTRRLQELFQRLHA
jgi:branched-chain amino acid aminotransferase